jgi:probable rRNA maturation factor
MNLPNSANFLKPRSTENAKSRMVKFKITKETNGRPPRLPFRRMKEAVLGNSYDLSLVFANSKLAQKLNKDYRNKTYVPNVLAFPISDDAGEIFINLEVAKAEASKYNYSPSIFIGYLFIHALCHLKGHDHGNRMEKEELRFRKQFKILPKKD